MAGEIPWRVLFHETKPSVIMQLDIGNTLAGGGDPIALLQEFPKRARSLHIKDFGGAESCAVGEGTVDWTKVFTVCEKTQRVEWLVIEQGEKRGGGLRDCAPQPGEPAGDDERPEEEDHLKGPPGGAVASSRAGAEQGPASIW